MTTSRSPYRRIDGVNLIEITLSGLDQLFNTLDPSPFHEKDLDADAEDYIVGAARELPAHEPFKLILYLPALETEAPGAAALVASIHHYFDYRRQTTARDLRLLLRQGRASLAIGLAFLATCLLLREILSSTHGTIERVFAEGLLIAGWVAMWRPLEVFLYDWWPLNGTQRIYAKLSAMAIDIRSGGPDQAALPARDSESNVSALGQNRG
jgi:hypothetical protein